MVWEAVIVHSLINVPTRGEICACSTNMVVVVHHDVNSAILSTKSIQ